MSSYASLTSYQDAYNRAKRARNPLVGRKLDRHCRLSFRAGGIHLTVDDKLIAIIRQDDTVELKIPGTVNGYYYTKWLGVISRRYDSRRVGLIHERQFPRYRTSNGFEVYDYARVKEYLVPAVDGVRFNMITGECLNPIPWPMRRDQRDKALEWRRKWTKFRKAFTTMAKVGAFDHILINVGLTTPIPPELFHRYVQDDEYHEMAKLLSWSANYSLRMGTLEGRLTRAEFYTEALCSTYASLRDKVRGCAGCYIEELPRLAA